MSYTNQVSPGMWKSSAFPRNLSPEFHTDSSPQKVFAKGICILPIQRHLITA